MLPPFQRRPSGPHPRLRLGLLMACAAAFLLVPAANAAAAPTVHVEIKGSGSGELTSEGGLQEGPGEFNKIGEGKPVVHCSGSEPGAGVCDSTMSELFPGLWVFAVHPIADPGSEFTGWEMTGATNNGGCTEAENWELNGAVQCSITSEDEGGAATIVGKFEQPEPEPGDLTVEIDGNGAGEVRGKTKVLLPVDIECIYESPGPAEGGEKADCEDQMATFSEFIGGVVEAKAAPGSEFAGWKIIEGINIEPENEPNCNIPERCAVGTENLEEDAKVKATFCLEGEPECLVPPAFLTVVKTGDGEGTVISEPKGELGGIECGPLCLEETDEFKQGDVVTLFALEPEQPESTFGGWTGCDDEPGPRECRVTLEGNEPGEPFEVEAEFNLDRTLTIEKAGSGSGSVRCNGGECAASYPHGTELTLEASADSGSTFAGWSGGGCSGTGTCVLTLEADTPVTATFTANPPLPDPCDTNPALCPKQPPETCETNPALCPPGAATANGVAQVKGNKALLKLRCSGGPCKGVAKLLVKLPGSKKSVVIGKASFSIAADASKTVKVKITNGLAKRLLKQGKALMAQLKGSGVRARTVKLKQQGGGKKRNRRQARR